MLTRRADHAQAGVRRRLSFVSDLPTHFLPLRLGPLHAPPQLPLPPPIQLCHLPLLHSDHLAHPPRVPEGHEEVHRPGRLRAVQVLQGRNVEVVVVVVTDHDGVDGRDVLQRDRRLRHAGGADVWE